MFISLRCGGDGDIQTTQLVDLVKIDFREHDLFLETHGVVATAIEGLRIQATEVANTRHRHRYKALQELVHALLAQSHLDTDRPAFTDLETCDGFACLGNHRLLASDGGHVRQRAFNCLAVLRRLTNTHVQGDLGDTRHFHHVIQAKLLLQLCHDFFLVNLLKIAHGSLTSGVQRFAVRFEEADFLVALNAETYTVRLLGLRIPDRHVGVVNTGFLFNNTALNTALRIRTHMLLDDVNTGHDQAAIGENFLDLATLTLVLARGYDDFVITLNLQHALTRLYITSGAREMIFVNCSVHSWRVPGPKILVPIGALLLLNRTAAFSSKRINEPSGRRTP